MFPETDGTTPVVDQPVDVAPAVTTAPVQPETNLTDDEPADADKRVYDYNYVKNLRKESASYRTKYQETQTQLESLNSRLGLIGSLETDVQTNVLRALSDAVSDDPNANIHGSRWLIEALSPIAGSKKEAKILWDDTLEAINEQREDAGEEPLTKKELLQTLAEIEKEKQQQQEQEQVTVQQQERLKEVESFMSAKGIASTADTPNFTGLEVLHEAYILQMSNPEITVGDSLAQAFEKVNSAKSQREEELKAQGVQEFLAGKRTQAKMTPVIPQAGGAPAPVRKPIGQMTKDEIGALLETVRQDTLAQKI